MRSRTIRLITGLAVASFTASVPAVHARSPWNLSGETLQGAPTVTSLTCSSIPQLGMSYTVTGKATGPYPGAFIETGTIAWHDAPEGTDDYTELTASFTIDSPRGQVTGTKHANAGIGCNTDGANVTFVTGREFNAYTATIKRSTGRERCVTDTGQFDANLLVQFGPPAARTFEERYDSFTRGGPHRRSCPAGL